MSNSRIFEGTAEAVLKAVDILKMSGIKYKIYPDFKYDKDWSNICSHFLVDKYTQREYDVCIKSVNLILFIISAIRKW